MPWPATAPTARRCRRRRSSPSSAACGERSSTRASWTCSSSISPSSRRLMPSTTPRPFRPEATADENGSAPAAPAEVLVLNRDPELRAFLDRALYAGNYSSTTVSTATEARACLRRGGVAVVLVSVEDSLTTELDAFLGEMRGQYPSVPVVAIAPRPAGEL